MNRKYFDFSSLISDFSNPFTVIKCGNGRWDFKGDWVGESGENLQFKGAIIGFSERKVLRSEGTITTKDKHLFMQEPIPEALIGSKARYRGQEYVIESETENAEFTGVYSYVLRWCSAFDT